MTTNTTQNEYPETIDEFLASFEAPYQKLSCSYSHDEDDKWVTERRHTCISRPTTPGETLLLAIADEYYSEWRKRSMAWAASRDAVLTAARTGKPLDADLADRAAAEESIMALASDITRRYAAQVRAADGGATAVKSRLTFSPPVCNIGTLATNPRKGFLDLLWYALT